MLRDRLSRWWFNTHQRGVFMHCQGVFGWCVLENIAHDWLRVPIDDHVWVCRRHDAAVDRAAARHLYGERARRIRQLGWGR